MRHRGEIAAAALKLALWLHGRGPNTSHRGEIAAAALKLR